MKDLSDVVVIENANGENVTLTAPDDTIKKVLLKYHFHEMSFLSLVLGLRKLIS